MTKRIAAILMTVSALAACSNGGTASQNAPTFPTATTAATTAAATSGAGGGTVADPNTVAGFCQLMTETITTNWPPKDAAAATLISPLLRNWSNVAEFKDIAPALLAVADWTASMSIMSTVPAPPSDVATAYSQITAFESSHCA
ncbi:MAG TPA: hypothetical protein VHR16_08435 [Candidatus Limnocylindrales bacterium]|jgi:hypothetical protein|nr:hypothetical protein [Candidatus Limnocylindrales bacterium]